APGAPLAGPGDHALRPGAVPQPYRGRDPRLPAAGSPQRETRQTARSLLTARGLSARLALADAELDPGREDADRVGSMMGSALGGVAFAEAQVGSVLTRGPRGLDPALALAVFPGAASCNIAIEFGFTGPNSTNAMSC